MANKNTVKKFNKNYGRLESTPTEESGLSLASETKETQELPKEFKLPCKPSKPEVKE